MKLKDGFDQIFKKMKVTDHLKKAKEKDIKIAITANANAVTVAEHVMFVLLNIAKRKDLFDKTVRDGNFKDRNKLPKTIEVWKKIF